MTGMIVWMVKEFAAENGHRPGDDAVVDIRVHPEGDIDYAADRSYPPAVFQASRKDLDFKPISQLLTIRKLQFRGWKLSPSNSWEEAQS